METLLKLVTFQRSKSFKANGIASRFYPQVVIACYEAEMNIVVHANNGSADIDQPQCNYYEI